MALSTISNGETGLSARTKINAGFASTDLKLGTSSEVANFSERVVAAGGSVDSKTLAALDNFVVKGKAEGWWSLLVEVHPACGRGLSSAIQKLKYYSTAAMTATNFVAADYEQSKGFSLQANTNKYIQTGFVPSAASLARNNIFIGISLIASPSDVYDYILGDDQPGGEDHSVFANQRIYGLSSNYNSTDNYSSKVVTINVGTNFHCHYNGARVWSYTAAVGGGEPDTQVMYFRSKRYGAIGYSRGAIGMVCWGEDMTEDQARLCNLAILEFEQAIGRTRLLGPCVSWLGDSITGGQVSGNYFSGHFSERSSLLLGLRNNNVAQQSAKLISDGATAAGLYPSRTQYAAMANGIFVTAIGTNDIAADPLKLTTGTSATIATFKSNLTSLLQSLIESGKAPFCVGPFYRDSTVGSETCCRAWQVAAAEAAAATTPPTPFMDGDRIFRDLATPNSCMTDTVHPNALGHDRIAKWVFGMINRGEIRREPSLDFASIAMGATGTIAVEVLNAAVGQSVKMEFIDAITAGLRFSAYVSAANTVTVVAENTTALSIDATAFRIRIIVSP